MRRVSRVNRVKRLVQSRVGKVIVVLAFACAIPVGSAEAGQAESAKCNASASLVQLPALAEASGLAISRRSPGRLWAHNDSGDAVLVSLDSKGAITGQVRVTGAAVEDWEAIAVGSCGNGSCLYVGDIGDNDAARKQITLYQVPEPERPDGTAEVSAVYHASYPDGAHDAEGLFAGPDGRLYIVTKGETGPLALYRFPAKLQAGSTAKLERVAGTSKPDATSRITDAAMTSDGQWIVLRSRTALTFYRAADLLGGQWKPASTVDLTGLNEPQGEAVALGSDNTVFLAGEGGGKGQPGTFARFSCPMPRK